MRRWRKSGAFLTVLVLPVFFAAQPAYASAGDIYAVAGGVSTGAATTIGQAVASVLVHGTDLYLNDRIHSVVRQVDLSTGTETGVAGYGSYGFSGDGGPATAAGLDLDSTTSSAMDSAGNLFIADTGTNRIRKVSTTGVITTVAGTGIAGYSGDGGPATSAKLDRPAGVAVDSSGNLYIADSDNNRIRKVSTSGTISTIAGTGTAGYSGDGAAATSAQINGPQGLAVSGSDIYVADTFNQRVRKIQGSTGNISTVAGTGVDGYNGDNQAATSATLSLPMSVAVDSSGNLLIADYNNNRIRQVSTTGTITTVAGNGTAGYAGDGGSATAAEISHPTGVASPTAGTIYIADFANNRARRVTSGTITTVAGNGTPGPTGDGGAATSAELNGGFGLAVDSAGDIFVADQGNNVVRKITPGGTITTVAGNGTTGFSGDGGPATSAQLDQPYAVAVDSDGNLYISDLGNQRIRKVFASNGYIYTIAGTGSAGFSGDGGLATSAQIHNPIGLFSVSPTVLYFADSVNNRIREIAQSGTNYYIYTIAGNGTAAHSGDGGAATSAAIDTPVDVAVDSSGNYVIAEQGDQYVRKVDASSGDISTVAGTGPPQPPYTPSPCFDPRLDNYSHPPLGDGGPATSAQLNCPTGVAIDSAGNIYIADFEISTIREVFASNGYIYTVAGQDGNYGWSGDGGPGTSAYLYGPVSVRMMPNGDVVFADEGNNRVRRLARS